MKPSWHHYWVAHTSVFSMCLGVIGAIGLMLLTLHEEGAFVADVWIWLLIVLAAVPTGLIGLIVGAIFIWGFFLSHIAARIQGWPFAVGDEVIVLAGPHKNVKTKIYEIWTERGQVRIDLGHDLKESVKDVFCAVQVCKIRPNKALHLTPTRVTLPAGRYAPVQEARHGQA